MANDYTDGYDAGWDDARAEAAHYGVHVDVYLDLGNLLDENGDNPIRVDFGAVSTHFTLAEAQKVTDRLATAIHNARRITRDHDTEERF